jgi:hypothetical protein
LKEETVRFYWRRQEAGIPLAEIPEQDRNPLRVRRSVVQAYAPDVVKQLEEGRFVAAAWQAGGSISVILCHPNLAKGPADTLLVDTMALPRVVGKLGGWDEIPEATKLFLTAFGSEAASVEECVAARRDLANWLVEHRQPDMAAVVKHFSAFPFGVTWKDVPSETRSDIILEAYKDQKRTISQAFGVTYQEAIEQHVLPYVLQPMIHH